MKYNITILFSLIIFWGFLFPSISCPVPVYQYALEFWEADLYRLTIFHDAPFTSTQQEVLNYLKDNPDKANIEVRTVDINDDMDDMTRNFYQQQDIDELPWLVVQYPQISWKNYPVWNGPFNKKVIDSLMTSPVRKRIADKLSNETTAVWVLLESGNRSKDRNASRFMENELTRLEQTLKLADPELWWDGTGAVGKDDLPRIKFELITLSPDNSDEQYFIKMLLQSEEGLEEYVSEPMVFPVYGRGLLLWSIIGTGINEWNVGEAAEFLIGPCSCQVKMLNPGLDILMSKDWDNEITRITAGIDTPLTGMADFEAREEQARKELELQSERLTREETDPDKVVYLDLSFDDDNNQEEEEEVQVSALDIEEENRDLSQYFWFIILSIFIAVILVGLSILKFMNKDKGRRILACG